MQNRADVIAEVAGSDPVAAVLRARWGRFVAGA